MGAGTMAGDVQVGSLLNSGLLGWWGCHELSGNPRLDSSGGGNSLVETNGVVANAAGLIGQAASFTATNYLKLSAQLIKGGPFSLSCWVNPTALGSFHLMSQATAATTGIFLSMTAVGGNFRVGTGATANVPFPSALAVGAWTHLAGTFDGSTQVLYINGQPQGTAMPAAVNYGGAAFTLGAESNNGALILNGLLQMAGVWSRAINPGEVTSLYGAGNGLDFPYRMAA